MEPRLVGKTLLHYEITGLLGKGGMGEVYRARDTRLQRDVALKFLSQEVTSDAERLARFEREAQTLATLQHPNIASVYGFEQADEGRFLVMELVEGEDLSVRLARGAIDLDESVEIACAIAEGLNAAHERGIVHRDLKPANVIVTPSGDVKILDFGLAKAITGEPDADPAHPTMSPTITAAMTQAGTILGTAAYMSPEQARGRAADRRADIWALGVILYEMLTGATLFAGETVTDTLAAVLTREPDLEVLPPGTPRRVRRALARCLARDPKVRWHAAADVRIELRQTDDPDGEREAGASARPRAWVGIAAVLILAALVGGWSLGRRQASPEEGFRLRLAVPGAGFSSASYSAISPDGRKIAWVSIDHDGDTLARSAIRVQALDEFSPTILPGTEHAANPCFSPDGRSVAYRSAADGALYRVALAGGVPTKILEDAPRIVKLAWPEDGFIYYAGVPEPGSPAGIRRVPETGGEVELVAESGEGNRALYHPQLAEGTDWLLYTLETSQGIDVGAYNLETGERRRLIEGATTPYFVPPSIVVYHRPSSSDLAAVRVDPRTMVRSSEGVRVVERVVTADLVQGAFDLARNGTLIYTPGRPGVPALGDLRTLQWLDASGKADPLPIREASWAEPRLSSDGRSLIVREVITPFCRLWNHDLERGTLTRIVFDEDAHSAVWSPTGRTVVFRHDSDDGYHVVERNSDGTGESRVLYESADHDLRPESITSDGRYLLVNASANGGDLWVLDLQEGGEPTPYVSTEFSEQYGAFSPDDAWIAYASNASGRYEIYVQGWPRPGRRHQVSIDGGTHPRWGDAGRKLFYTAGDRLVVVDVDTSEGFRAGNPTVYLEGIIDAADFRNYDVSTSGTRLVVARAAQGSGGSAELRVVPGWADEIRALLNAD